MEATLTGKPAAEALSLFMRLGAADARFDGNRVARAVLTSSGRARLAGALALVRFVRPFAARSTATSTRSSRRRARRSVAASAAASPGRPRPDEAV